MLTEREKLFYDKAKEKWNCEIQKIDQQGMPDFLINGEMYIEVKNADVNIEGVSSPSPSQERQFRHLDKPLKIAYVSLKNKSIEFKSFVPKEGIFGYKTMSMTFSDEEYEIFRKARSQTDFRNWHDFFIYLLENKEKW